MSELTQEEAQMKYIALVNAQSPGWNATERSESGTGPVFSRPVMDLSDDSKEPISELSKVIFQSQFGVFNQQLICRARWFT